MRPAGKPSEVAGVDAGEATGPSAPVRFLECMGTHINSTNRPPAASEIGVRARERHSWRRLTRLLQSSSGEKEPAMRDVRLRVCAGLGCLLSGLAGLPANGSSGPANWNTCYQAPAAKIDLFARCLSEEGDAKSAVKKVPAPEQGTQALLDGWVESKFRPGLTQHVYFLLGTQQGAPGSGRTAREWPISSGSPGTAHPTPTGGAAPGAAGIKT